MSAGQIGIALKGRRNGNGWLVRCPVPSHGKGRGDRSPSRSIADGDDGRLLATCFTGCDFLDILDALKRLGLVDDVPKSAGLASHRVDCATRNAGVEISTRSDFPLRIWSESVSAEHSLLLVYLASRRLTLPDHHNEVLRFHPNCAFGEGVRHPCMIGLFRDIRTNEPKAIHRTALTTGGRKMDKPMSLGPIGGGAIKLTADENVEQGLTIGEGIETTLAGMALNFRPAWALGSAGAVKAFQVLSGIECLTILVDNDESGTGQQNALECSKRWTSAGREVFRVVPTAVDADMADIVRGVAA